jgi:peptidoglycan hydrolase-like protein with peptidoglycan-binding domain
VTSLLFRTVPIFLLSAALIVFPAFASRVHRAPTSGQGHRPHTAAAAHSTRHKSVSKAPPRSHGQQAIDTGRVTQIQQALIREHYLSGPISGIWDESTVAAMQKYQSDQGWQTKLMPDSRALVKLGLGPDYSNAINANNARFTAPPPVSTISSEQVAGFSQAAGVNQ